MLQLYEPEMINKYHLAVQFQCAEEIEMYENYKYNMNEQMPGMPILDIDEFLRLEYGQGRVDVAGGGLPAILGV